MLLVGVRVATRLADARPALWAGYGIDNVTLSALLAGSTHIIPSDIQVLNSEAKTKTKTAGSPLGNGSQAGSK